MKYKHTLMFLLLLFLFSVKVIIPQQNVTICATDPNNIPSVGNLVNVTWTLKVLLVEFQDVKHSSKNYTFNDFNNLFFSNGIYVSPNMYSPDGEKLFGSMKDYYAKVSNGLFNLTGYILNRDDNHDNIPDWLILPLNKGQYESTNYNAFWDAALSAAIAAGLDVSTNSNTKLAIIYAGETYRGGGLTPRENSSYYYSGNYYALYVNGELFAPGQPYEAERSDAKFSEIGIHAHEFGHLLGWPDLYYVGGYGFGNGTWDLMADGQYNGPDTPQR